MLRQEIKRIVLSPMAWLSVVLLSILMLVGMGEDIFGFGSGGWLKLFFFTENFGTSVWGEALLCPLAAASIYYEERNIHYDVLALTRAGRRRYCMNKIAAVCLGTMLLYIMASYLFLLLASVISEGAYSPFVCENALSGTFWEPLLEKRLEMAVLAIHVLLYSFTAAIYAMISLILSVFCSNRYVLFAAPFLLAQMAEFLSHLTPIKSFIDIRLLIYGGGDSWQLACLWCVLLNMLYLMILGAIYSQEMKWRAVHG